MLATTLSAAAGIAGIAKDSGAERDFPYLTVLVALPGVAALVVSALARRWPVVARRLAMVAALAVGGLAIAILAVFKTVAGYQMVTDHQWIGAYGISWHLGIDGISLFLVALVALVFPLVLGSAAKRDAAPAFAAWMLLLEAACLGSFVALDLFAFFVFFEATLVPAYFIIGGWGGNGRGAAALKFFLYTLTGSAFLLVGMVVLVVTYLHQSGVTTFDLTQLVHTHLSYPEEVLLFLSFSAAFVVKTPVFPFHTWSPDAYAEAPFGGSIVLAAVMAKLGTYGLLRFDLALFPRASVHLAPLLLTLGVAGIVYGAVVAAAQRDLKRLVAYSSLSHLGFVVLGTFAFTSEGLSGSVLQMVNHGIVVAGLFLVVGMLARRQGTWQLRVLGGLQRSAPMLAAVTMVVVLAAIGLPGLNGFVGEFLILAGTFVTHRWWAVVATVGVVLSAVYLLWAYQQAFHGPAPNPETTTAPRPPSAKAAKLRRGEIGVMIPILALIVGLGVYPAPVLDRIGPSVNAVVAYVDAATGSSPPRVGGGGAGTAAGAGASPGRGTAAGARTAAGAGVRGHSPDAAGGGGASAGAGAPRHEAAAGVTASGPRAVAAGVRSEVGK